ncbi:hypothetical protein ABLB98_06635 [Acinetobacter sp. XH1639]|uniref:hypothetical protein n=1 Tax=Acinetobacter sp. XH1639 TaxID=3157368 RepID=UPI0032B46A29
MNSKCQQTLIKTLLSFNLGNKSCSIQHSNTSVFTEQLNTPTVSNLFSMIAPITLLQFFNCQLNLPSARVPWRL